MVFFKKLNSKKSVLGRIKKITKRSPIPNDFDKIKLSMEINMSVLKAIGIEIWPTAIGLNRFTGWSLSSSKSIMSFKRCIALDIKQKAIKAPTAFAQRIGSKWKEKMEQQK